MKKESEQIIRDLLKSNCNYYGHNYYFFKINLHEVLVITIYNNINYHICSDIRCGNNTYEAYIDSNSNSQISFAASLAKTLNIDHTLYWYYYNSYLDVDQVFEFFPQKLKEFYIFNMDLF